MDLDDIAANASENTGFDKIIEEVASRRRFLKMGAGASALSFLGLGAISSTAANAAMPVAKKDTAVSLGFDAVAPNTLDAVSLPAGYQQQVINRWGDPLFLNAPTFKPDASNGGDDQAQQFGENHDGLHFFPIDSRETAGSNSTEGLIVTNHEYITPHYFFPVGVLPGNDKWNGDWVKKSQHAHGVSVMHMRLVNGKWEPVLDSIFNRSINANTPMTMVGPAAGHALLRTKADPSGKLVLGTFGNCGNGFTPWNTYLTCEENFTDYFGVGKQDADQVAYLDAEQQRALQRYKGASKTASDNYRWDTDDTRFDWTNEPNEVNRFGWVVEIDPFDPHSAPKKLTALGRFKHENAALTFSEDNRVVVYMGDDQRSEYIYKFVSSRHYNPNKPAENRLLLDEGTLYVAQFHSKAGDGEADGTGTWIPLVLDTATTDGRTLGELFNNDMGKLLVYTREAADAVGATPMDRPEWVAVHPTTREAYVTLTNNSQRGSGNERWPDGLTHPDADGPNPRNENRYGQIVRWRDGNGDPAGTEFEWDVFVLVGNPNLYPADDLRSGSESINKANTFNSPDGLGFDKDGRLWVQTDGNYSNEGIYEGQGNNSMLIADPVSKELRRFLVGPKGCEITGITWTPDQRHVFINVQHPGEAEDVAAAQQAPLAVSSWPDGTSAARPRSATVVISREDGGVVGA